MKRILISAGDYSADLHGESLVRELKRLDPSLAFSALGGVRLRAVVDEFLKDMVAMDISGFSQPVKQFFAVKRILQQTVFPRLESRSVDAVVLIDYYGFNIYVARKARQHGIPVFYFVSPQVWASRGWRVRQLKAAVTKMLVIFPFEEELYRSRGVPVEFVGHPLVDRVAQAGGAAPPAAGNGSLRLGLMPGSRPKEVSRHLPLMLDSARRLKSKFPGARILLFTADNIPERFYRSCLGGEPVEIVRGDALKERMQLTVCLTKSGTATLENALLGVPMVVIYRMSWFTYWIARLLIQVPYISMPNLLCGREVVPELIQGRADPARMADAAERLVADPGAMEKMRSDLAQIKGRLGPPGAYGRAARAILQSLS